MIFDAGRLAAGFCSAPDLSESRLADKRKCCNNIEPFQSTNDLSSGLLAVLDRKGWNKSSSSRLRVKNREDLMDRTTRCPKCGKRMIRLSPSPAAPTSNVKVVTAPW